MRPYGYRARADRARAGCSPPVTVESMIGYLEGVAKTENIVVAGGVGYVVCAPFPLIVGAQVQLLVTTIVREESITLFGFSDRAEQLVFEALCRLHGVGSQTALSLLRDVGLSGIQSRDAKVIQKANGVGAKLAARIAAELVLPELPESGVSSAHIEIANTLVALGFSMNEALEAVKSAVEADPDADEEQWITESLLILRGN